MTTIEKQLRRRELALSRLRETLEVGQRAREDPGSIVRFEAYIERLPQVYESFEENHFLLSLAAQDEESLAKDKAVRLEADQLYFDSKALFKELSKTSVMDSTPPETKPMPLRLPRINLPAFNGDFKLWPTYYELFNNMIHKSDNISCIEKFHYLMSSLEGEPRNLLKALPLTESNYDEAYTRLVTRYQNKRKLAFAYWDELHECRLRSGMPRDLRKLLDVFEENVSLMRNLGFSIEQWDFVLFYLLLKKLEPGVRQKFEQSYAQEEIPSYKQLLEFLQGYCKSLELSGFKNDGDKKGQKAGSKGGASCLLNVKEKSEQVTACEVCGATHSLVNCPQFLALEARERSRLAYKVGVCVNCLQKGHKRRTCKEPSCTLCDRKHNQLLHFSQTQTLTKPLTVMTRIQEEPGTVLLATAIVEVQDKWGRFQTVRSLLDCGSQASFLTKPVCKRLGLNPAKSRFSVSGLGTGPSIVTSAVQCSVRSRYSEEDPLMVDALVLPQICEDLPVNGIDTKGWGFLAGLSLADPCFARTGPIEMLLGADVFCTVLKGNRRPGSSGQPVAIETWFGWCVMGGFQSKRLQSVVTLQTVVDSQLEGVVRRFWEIDSLHSPDKEELHLDRQVEESFKKTAYRLPSGRFSVALPFKDDVPTFDKSREIAIRRLLSLERRLRKERGLSKAYSEFLKDYLQAGHMRLLSSEEVVPGEGYYLPHHPVVRPDSVTTKLRVVFDASCKAANGISLNEVLAVGPKLQLRIVAVLLRFRMHAVGFIVDIRQMYRQILLHPEDQKYQRIVWREGEGQPIRDYQLTTVTYGMASSPFLAIRTLQEVAEQGKEIYPQAARALTSDTYMDDVVTGSSSVQSALNVKNDLQIVLQEAGFELHKWACNRSELLETVESGDSSEPVAFESADIPSVKVLGLQWSPKDDFFGYEISSQHSGCTKRKLLGNLARIFDPLGLISPVTFFLKFLFQTLWVTGKGWDDPLDGFVERSWSKWQSGLESLRKLRVPRFVAGTCNQDSRQLHGFCDASERGYAAAVYLRVIQEGGEVVCHLLTSKTKVAPLKRQSIPRLELCAALLLTELLIYVKQECKSWVGSCPLVAWSDSTTVLSWLRSQSVRYKPFVGNRVGRIQDELPPGTFRYVPSAQNPADVASRGVWPEELVGHSLWWHGPSWLWQEKDHWPKGVELKPSPEAEQEYKVSCLLGVSEGVTDLLSRYSSLQRLQRVVAWLLRFVENGLSQRRQKERCYEPLTQEQLQKALLKILAQVQATVFQREIDALKKKRKLPKALQALNLFIDTQGILRVGGRLEAANLQDSAKYPILLPRKHRLTELIIMDCHSKYLHPGLQAVHFLLRARYWILSPRRAIRGVLSKCVRCFRAGPKPLEPLMGQLPASRVSEAKAFSTSGVDFGGPFLVRPTKGRGRRSTKMYVCIFVCHATKAIHLELVFDLTAEAFIAALRRFISRRGHCSVINCDNATNFVGARRKLEELLQEVSGQEGIRFCFNPPRTPHFGGLFEAGIKSVKTHLARSVGTQVLTIEEFLTFVAQVEAVLNSRPLGSVSSDPRDLEVLTPGHFLMLPPLTQLADPDVLGRPLNLLSRWQLVQKLQQSFWQRWQREYLTTLHQRQKWTVAGPALQEGAVVVIREDNVRPLHWNLGRVVQLHPGRDGVSRVATVRTEKGTFQRPLVRLCPLPFVTSGEAPE